MLTRECVVAQFTQWWRDAVHEIPDGSNRTSIGVEYGWNGVAWCCESCSVANKRCCAPDKPKLWTAGVADAKGQAQRGVNGMTWVPRNGIILPADFSCFDFGGRGNPSDMHISCVVNPNTQDVFETIGGNERNRVTRQFRDRKFVMGFVRLPFVDAGPAPAPHPPTAKKEAENMIVVHPGETIPVPIPHGTTAVLVAAELFGRQDGVRASFVVGKSPNGPWRRPFGWPADEGQVAQGTWRFAVADGDDYMRVGNTDEHGRALTIATES